MTIHVLTDSTADTASEQDPGVCPIEYLRTGSVMPRFLGRGFIYLPSPVKKSLIPIGIVSHRAAQTYP